jgi:hypothetical protein
MVETSPLLFSALLHITPTLSTIAHEATPSHFFPVYPSKRVVAAPMMRLSSFPCRRPFDALLLLLHRGVPPPLSPCNIGLSPSRNMAARKVWVRGKLAEMRVFACGRPTMCTTTCGELWC